MRVSEWDEQYRSGEKGGQEDPTPLVVSYAADLAPGRALDLACGAGRNAIYLAGLGWDVTAVDASATAVNLVAERARHAGVPVQTQVADLEAPGYAPEPGAWDLILDCYYLQRNLFMAMREGVRGGGIVIAIVHIPDPGGEPSPTRAAPGELRGYFEGWQILHAYEGPSRDRSHKRPVAEIVARRYQARFC